MEKTIKMSLKNFHIVFIIISSLFMIYFAYWSYTHWFLYKDISYIEVLNKNLKVMDSTAISLAKESKIPIIITNLNNKHSIINAIRGIGKFSKIS